MPAALLDVDGTLVDTNYHHALAWFRAFRRHEITVPVWRIHRHVGMGGDQLVPALIPDIDSERHEGIEEARRDEYSKLIGEVQPLHGAPEQELREAGAVAVFEGVDELRQNLDETPLSFS